jgi:hypothetical protein
MAAEAALASLGNRHEKIHDSAELWPWLDQLGDKQSTYLLEQFVPGSVYHVDSVAAERQVVFAEAHAYGAPPLDTSHLGGVFTTRTLPRGSAEVDALLDLNRKVLEELGFLRGVTHAEFLKAHSDGKIYFLEVAARVGGPIFRMSSKPPLASTYGASGRASEVGAGKQPYQLPKPRTDYAGAIVSLARQENPDTSGYNDPEIIYRVAKYHHAGFILKSSTPQRIEELLESYSMRFQADFLATQPVPEKPSN